MKVNSLKAGKKSRRIFGKEDSLDSDEYDELAEETREDLMDKVMDKIGSMSKEELIKLLIDTQGELEMEI